MIARWLEQLGLAFIGTNLFRMALAAISSFLVSLLVGKKLIGFFKNRRVIEDVTQPDSEQIERMRASKRGTPTMGGIMIIAGTLVAALFFADIPSAGVAAALGVMLAFAALGSIDDLLKLRLGRPGVGKKLTRKKKLLIGLIIGAAAGWIFMQYPPSGDAGTISLPLTGASFRIGWWYVLVASLIVAGAANGVNLADGLDGLAGGSALFMAVALAVIGIVAANGQAAAESAIVCLGLGGALAGFLVYNRYPAKIFMGDTGSLAIGGLLGVATLSLGQEILFLLLGAAFMLEAASVAMQVGWFKLTRKRIFKCAPYHHHLEFLGWKETTVTRHFWLLSALAGSLSILLAAGG